MINKMQPNKAMISVINRLYYMGANCPKPSNCSDGRWRAMLAHLDREYYKAIEWGSIWKD